MGVNDASSKPVTLPQPLPAREGSEKTSFFPIVVKCTVSRLEAVPVLSQDEGSKGAVQRQPREAFFDTLELRHLNLAAFGCMIDPSLNTATICRHAVSDIAGQGAMGDLRGQDGDEH